MALSLVSGSTQYVVSTNFTAVTNYPVTVICKMRDNLGTTVQNDRLVVQISDNNDIDRYFRLGRNQTGNEVRAVKKWDVGGAPPIALSSTSYANGEWITIAGEWGASDSMYAFLEGVRGNEQTALHGNPTDIGILIDTITLGFEFGQGTDPFDGGIAEVGVYNYILSDDDHARSVRQSLLSIRPDKLVTYMSCNGPQVVDLIGGLLFENINSPTFEETPPIYRPSKKILYPFASVPSASNLLVKQNNFFLRQ